MRKNFLVTMVLLVSIFLFTSCDADVLLNSEDGIIFLNMLGTLEMREAFVNDHLESSEEKKDFADLVRSMVPEEYDYEQNPDLFSESMFLMDMDLEDDADEEALTEAFGNFFETFIEILTVFHEAIDEAEKMTFGTIISYEDGGIDWRSVPEEPIFDASLLEDLFGHIVDIGYDVEFKDESGYLSYGILFEIGSPNVSVFGEKFELDVAPIMVNNSPMVPIRLITDYFGMDMNWDHMSKTLTATHNFGSVIEMTIGSNSVYINGEEMFLDEPSMVLDGRTLVPLSFILEIFSFELEWDELNQTIFLY